MTSQHDADPVMPYQLEARWDAAVASERGPVRDWLDDILDDNAEEPPAPPEHDVPKTSVKGARKPRPSGKKQRKRPKRHAPDTPRTAWDSRPQSPRQSLLDAWANVPYRLKWLMFHTAAAAIGWRLGWITWSTNTAAWLAAGHATSFSAFVLYGLGGCALGLYRKFHTWAWPVALAAAVPVTSVVLGLLLYGSGYQNLRIPW